MGSVLCLLLLQIGGKASFSQSVPTPAEIPREWFDVAYVLGSAAHRLDLYLPPDGTGPFPVIVWVHGGAWRTGDKRLEPGAAQLRVLDHGYALASVGYRLSRDATFPAQIYDVKAAVRWLRANAGSLHLDPDRIGAWGGSAGGHLVALLGTSGGVEDLEDLSMGQARTSSRVQAVVDWFGPTDFLQMDVQARANGCPRFGGKGHNSPTSPESELIGVPITDHPDKAQAANPIRYVTADDPPFFLQHGSEDCTVAPQQSQLLYDALTPVVGQEHVHLSFLPAGHGGPPFTSEVNLERVLDFFDRYLK